MPLPTWWPLCEVRLTQQAQLHYAMALRGATVGWTPELREKYYGVVPIDSIALAAGMSFVGFIENIKTAALKNTPDDAKAALADVLAPPVAKGSEAKGHSHEPSRPFVKKWTTEALLPLVSGATGSPDFNRGKEIFASVACNQCHRIAMQGGIMGPDLTGVGGRFGFKDMLDSILDPSKVISDQYGATQFLTDEGKIIVGRVVNMNGTELQVMTNMLDPSQLTVVDRETVEETREATVSMMPSGLLDTLTSDEIIDLIAYLRAGGRSDHALYTEAVSQETDTVDPWLVFDGGNQGDGSDEGPGSGKHIVLISGDHEYRSEEGLPQLGKILSVHHGFKCTVLFAIDEATGVINPDNVENIPGLEALESADLVIMGLRFRNLPDDQMKRIMDYVEAGRPLMGLRTSTHPFDIPEGRKYARESWNAKEGGFGRRVLGETWVSHHGHHAHESTRGIIADPAHPIVVGIQAGDIWGPTDVYEVTLPLSGDGHAVVTGQILTGMNASDDAVTDDRNDPMIPIAWTRTYQGGRVFTTTMGSADDLPSQGVRRMLVNAAYWCLAMEDAIDPVSDVSIVGEYHPTPFGFNKFIPGKKPADYDLASPVLN